MLNVAGFIDRDPGLHEYQFVLENLHEKDKWVYIFQKHRNKMILHDILFEMVILIFLFENLSNMDRKIILAKPKQLFADILFVCCVLFDFGQEETLLTLADCTIREMAFLPTRTLHSFES